SPSWAAGLIAFSREEAGFGVEICTIKPDGTQFTRLTNTNGSSGQPSWSPDGNRIAFANTDGGDTEICAINKDGTGFQKLTDNTANDVSPTWSGDGSRIAFASNRAGNVSGVYSMAADGSNQQLLVPNPVNDGDPDWRW
ncbi:MAG: hypothetical protein FJX74_25240, partial [Armatimonadetes bacterium]|nr:hypothetical protein [Armatimonadota bacterium]